MKKTIWILAVLVIAGLAGFTYYNSDNSNSSDTLRANVEVSRGDIIEKALAVGTIEPEHQI